MPSRHQVSTLFTWSHWNYGNSWRRIRLRSVRPGPRITNVMRLFPQQHVNGARTAV